MLRHFLWLSVRRNRLSTLLPTGLPLSASVDIYGYAWSEAVSEINWRPGEHVTLIGPTGVGKTELMIALIRDAPRKWVVFLSTKRIDDTQTELKRSMDFRTITDGNLLNPEVASKYILAPRYDRRRSPEEQDRAMKREYVKVLDRAYWQTGWTVVIDELEYINRDLKIESPVNRLLRQGRSQGNSMLLGTQRPRYVTLHAYEQATHIFLWRQSDLSNVARAAELAGINREVVERIVPRLEHHDALYVNTVTGKMFVTNTRWE